jgi:hypothetical protein
MSNLVFYHHYQLLYVLCFYMTGSAVGLFTPASSQCNVLCFDIKTAMMSLDNRKT